MPWLGIFHESARSELSYQAVESESLDLPMLRPLPPAQRKEERRTDAPRSAGKSLGWEWGGWGPWGTAPGWAGALLPFNHSPVTCPKREAKAACPQTLCAREGVGIPGGGQELVVGGTSITMQDCVLR